MALNRTQWREYVKVIQTAVDGDYDPAVYGAAIRALDLDWPDGAGTAQANAMWSDFERSLATATNDDLDLMALAGGPNGAAVAFAEIRAILIFVGTAGALTFSGTGASNPWVGLGAAWTITPPAGTYFRIANPTDGKFPVNSGSKVIRVNNASGSTVLYDIAVIGTLT